MWLLILLWLFVHIHKYFECIYQMNEFHPSRLLISLASKPSSVKTVKRNQSWMLQFLKWQLILSNAIHPMPFSTNLAWGNELAEVKNNSPSYSRIGFVSLSRVSANSEQPCLNTAAWPTSAVRPPLSSHNGAARTGNLLQAKPKAPSGIWSTAACPETGDALQRSCARPPLQLPYLLKGTQCREQLLCVKIRRCQPVPYCPSNNSWF